mgnify:CR=1 FL=1
MNLTIDNTTCEDIIFNGNYLEKLYYGQNLVWERQSVSTGTPLTFTAEEANSTVELQKVGSDLSLADAVLQYSTNNGLTWNAYTLNTTITLAAVGDTVKFKGTNNRFGYNSNNYHKFVMSGKIAASGDITSLLNEVGGDCSLANYCYSFMFHGCTSLTTAPALPATTLASGCYDRMFQGCTSLTRIECLATDISATGCTASWVDNVAASGTFVKDPNMTSWTTGTSGIPSGWTVTY